jgi:hypothetical protein
MYHLILLFPASNVNTPAKVKTAAASGEQVKPDAAVLYRHRCRDDKGEKTFMLENQEYNQGAAEAVDETPQSPSEKLEESRPVGSLVPGAENQESVEIKNEINPNTE